MNFPDVFRALTGHDPFPWQQTLFAELTLGTIRDRCDVPTGLGKTSCIAVWTVALGASLSGPDRFRKVPRRLAYIVDRRVVVDQATEEVERLLETLRQAETDESLAVLRPLVAGLRRAATLPGDCGITVSTLRGQLADNHDWHLDPSRPAIIVGTVDMIGSRMLFAGYGGVGRSWRSLQAGLLLCDTWIVLDEAHLVPPFAALLSTVKHTAKRTFGASPIGITLMSATLAKGAVTAGDSKRTEDPPLFSRADEEHPEVKKRFRAEKTLRLLQVEGISASRKAAQVRDALATAMAREAIALAAGKHAVAVFANTVELVKAVAAAIEKHLPKEQRERVLPLTGEMRGAERDAVAKSSTLAAFDPARVRGIPTRPAFLVATACVEVGMDFDADHAICDAVALERMIQRLGRVNRRGEGKANIHVLLAIEPTATAPEQIAELDPPEATVLVLKSLPIQGDGFDASPAALRALDLATPLAQQALSREPVAPPLDCARLDDWSLTSLSPDHFPRPKVCYWLRGVTQDDSMTTSLVWRADLNYATSPDDAAAMVEVIPVASREVAQAATFRVAELLATLAETHPDMPLAVRSASGETNGESMQAFADPKKVLGKLASATVFLPAQVGGMLKAVPDASAEALKNPVVDVVKPEEWQRAVLRADGGEITVSLMVGSDETEMPGSCPSWAAARSAVIKHLRQRFPAKIIRFEKIVGILRAPGEDGSGKPSGDPKPMQAVAYFEIAEDVAAGRDEDLRSLAKREVSLKEHTRVAEAVARSLGEKLGLPPELSEAIALAARWHDRGKDRPWWQAAVGNLDGEALAKSAEPYFDHSRNLGYRHEFGSLIEARADDSLRNHPQRELILHLIAAHHGNARPSFEPRSFDRRIPTPECTVIAAEVPLRFAALQQQHGWWQLAWLEALVKCADAIASKCPDWTAP